jgi:hypothetical protein
MPERFTPTAARAGHTPAERRHIDAPSVQYRVLGD